ncbi:MAG TPA: L-histidine N(alpha)-methyltransferase [Gemmatimonadaceae bacterium]
MTSEPARTSAQPERDTARRRLETLVEIRDSLARSPRELPSKFFYDEHGSRLFEQITRLPEYYLTRVERGILETHALDIVTPNRPRTLIELGAGSAAKTRILIAAMQASGARVMYVPVDVSAEFLQHTREALERENPALVVEPVVSDISASIDVPAMPGPVLFAFLGSTIGNFEWAGALSLLRRVRARMHPGDRFLLGTDLRKNRKIIEAAYNDSRGVTAEFNRNILRVLNASLGADFDPGRFQHRAFYDAELHRIEMRLRSIGAQQVRIPGLSPISFDDGEEIRTELSHKYDRGVVEQLADSVRLSVTHWFTDPQSQFAVSVLEPRL